MFELFIYILGVLFVVYVGWGLMLYILQPRLLYAPMREVLFTPAEVNLEFENVIFKTADGLQLNGWFIPAPLEACTKTASARLETQTGKSLTGLVKSADSLLTGQFTILFCHGNGGNMTHCLDSVDIFYNLGLSCFIFDYRGYGESGGKPSEEGTYLDAQAAYKWLTEEKKVPPGDIIVFGISLGGSIAAHLSCRNKVAALVIESTFTSYADIGSRFYPYMPVKWFARFRYNTLEYIKDIHCPVMLIYSRDDEVIPFEFGLDLFSSANEPKEFVEIFGGHNDCFVVSDELYKNAWIRWLKFLGECREQSMSQPAL